MSINEFFYFIFLEICSKTKKKKERKKEMMNAITNTVLHVL